MQRYILNDSEIKLFDEIFQFPFIYEWVITTQLLLHGHKTEFSDYIYQHRCELLEKRLEEENITLNPSLKQALKGTLRDTVFMGLTDEHIRFIVRFKLYQTILRYNYSKDYFLRKDLFVVRSFDNVFKENGSVRDKMKNEDEFKKRAPKIAKKQARDFENHYQLIKRRFKETKFTELTAVIKFALLEFPQNQDPFMEALENNKEKLLNISEDVFNSLAEDFCVKIDPEVDGYLPSLSKTIAALLFLAGMMNYMDAELNNSLYCSAFLLLVFLAIRSRAYGMEWYRVRDTQSFDSDFLDIKEQLKDLQHLRKVRLKENKKAVVYTSTIPVGNFDSPFIDEESVPEKISGYRFLVQYGFTKSQMKEMQSFVEKEPEREVASSNQNDINDFTWRGVTFPRDKVRPIQNCPYTYFYFDEQCVRQQMQKSNIQKSDINLLINRFKAINIAPKFCAKVNDHGLKEIPVKSLTININQKQLSTHIKHEMKVAGTDRVLCSEIKDVARRETLYVGCWYFKDGLHTKQAVNSYLEAQPDIQMKVEGNSKNNNNEAEVGLPIRKM